MHKHLTFLGAAGVLGLCWYVALLWTKLGALLVMSRPAAIVGLCILAVVMAAAWRRPIIRSGTAEQAAGLALGLPLLGAIVDALGLTVADWLSNGTYPTSVAAGFGASFLLVAGAPFVVLLTAFYVVIPMGVISLWLLRRLGQRLWPELRGII